jgi:hypothetical protein
MVVVVVDGPRVLLEAGGQTSTREARAAPQVTVRILGKEVIIRMGFLEMGSSVLVREGRVLEGEISSTRGSVIVVMFAEIMVTMVITTLVASLQIIMQMLGLVLVMTGMLLLPPASLTFNSGW